MNIQLTKTFSQLGRNDATIAGGKGASLGEMTQAGIPVPGGFVVLTDSFEQFLEETDLVQEIDAVLHTVKHDEMHTVEHASEKIQALIKSAKMPDNIARRVLEDFDTLGAEFVAVRSSATAEDGASAAWAGQLDSFLNTTRGTLLQKVQHCWASLFTPRAIFYRFEKGLHGQMISVAVVVQKMVNSEVSGIAFSVHPVTEDYNQLIIEAGFGLGEAIVSGQVTPDSYVVEKDPRNILDINISTQGRGLFRKSGGGNEWIDIQEPKASSQVITKEQILELSEIIMRIEKHYGFPCDIEWAFEKGKFYVVQSRPITTLSSHVENGTRPTFKKFLTRRHAPLTDDIIANAWADRDRFRGLTGFDEAVTNLEIIDGDFCFDENWFSSIISRYENADLSAFRSFIEAGYIHGEKARAYARFLNIAPNFEGRKDQFFASLELLKNLLVFLPITHPLAKIIEQKVISILKKKGVKDEEMQEVLLKITFPLKKNTPTLEQEDFERIRFDAQKQDITQVEKQLKEHVKKYSFLGYREPFSSGYSLDFFREKLLTPQGLKTEHENSSIAFSQTEQEVIDLMQEFVYFRTYRTEKLYETLFYLEPLWKMLGKDCALSSPEDFAYYLHLEIQDLFEKKMVLSDVVISERRKAHALLLHDNVVAFIFGDRVAVHKSRYYTVFLDSMDRLVGAKASKGKTSGKVCIVRRVQDQIKIESGDVLVTTMTTPDMLLAMGKAVAFVTDEGGITCHAAIVAREMGKPCVIGTKNATEILRDGDLVEVDADKGVVQILRRALSEKGIRFELTFKEHHPPLWLFFWISPRYLEEYRALTGTDVGVLCSIKNSDIEAYMQTGAKDILDRTLDGKLTPGFFDNLHAKYSKNISELHSLQKKLQTQNSWTDADFLSTNKTIYGIVSTLYPMSNAFYVLSVAIEDRAQKKLEELRRKDSRLPVSIATYLHPKYPTYATEYQKELALLRSRNVDVTSHENARDKFAHNEVFRSEVVELARRYQYLTSLNAGLRSPESFLPEIAKNSVLTSQSHVCPPELLEDVEKLSAIAFFKDEISTFVIPFVKYGFQSYWSALADRLGISFVDLEQLHITDIPELFSFEKEKILDLVSKRRSETLYKHLPFEGVEISEGETAERSYAIELETAVDHPAVDTDAKEVKGKIGNPGVARGRVQIIASSAQFSLFKAGNVLVTTYTAPEFVPVMKASVAIVTDTGGATSHAAIVARELGKPCIVGTKNATQVLKDGDMVEVDANNGIVRKIK